MSGYGWRLRQRGRGNMHARQRSQAPRQIACRICDQVFMSIHALINHIESHMIQEEIAAARRQQELNFIATSQRGILFANNNPFQPSFSLPPISHERNPFHHDVNRHHNNIVGARPIIQQLPSLAVNNFRQHALQQPPGEPMQEPPHTAEGSTRPFLHQLERTMAPHDHTVQQQASSDNNNNSDDDSDFLDLTLKL